MERRGRWTVWTVGVLFVGLTCGAIAATAEMATPWRETGWRESLERAQAALAGGESRRAEEAWEEARRAAMSPAIPPTGLVDVGLAYLKIGEAAHDRQTAVARARQVFLQALFRARHRRDVDGLTAVSHAFASLGDCEIAERAFAVAVTMASTRPPAPACERADAGRHPSASPRFFRVP